MGSCVCTPSTHSNCVTPVEERANKLQSDARIAAQEKSNNSPVRQRRIRFKQDSEPEQSELRPYKHNCNSYSYTGQQQQQQQPSFSRIVEVKPVPRVSNSVDGRCKSPDMPQNNQSSSRQRVRPDTPRAIGRLGEASDCELINSIESCESLNNIGMPSADSADAATTCSLRLKKIADLLERDAISKEAVVKNLRYAAEVLDNAKTGESQRTIPEEDDLPEVPPSDVPNEVRDWLASTFTRSQTSLKQNREKPKFRSVANAIRAGIMVERIYRRLSSTSSISVPPNVQILLKAGIDEWCFDIFELNEASENHALKYVGIELLHKYDLINKFKIGTQTLEAFLAKCEEGYSKHNNPYHNLVHGADVAQTCHLIMHSSKLVNWLTDLEIFAALTAALIHDFEHTGTTNNYHVNTSSDLALLYNDRGVLENHHVSAVFRLLREDEYNILTGLSREEYKEFRGLVVELVLNTDMSLHFQQLKNMKQMLATPDKIEKEKALSLVLHCADISHPGKRWDLHYRWTTSLLEELFRQGDREKQLDLPCSPLCDRQTTMVAQSQVGFIDFIMEPSFAVMGDMLEKILLPLFEQQRQAGRRDEQFDERNSGAGRRRANSNFAVVRPWTDIIKTNRGLWKARAEIEEAEKAAKAARESAPSAQRNNSTKRQHQLGQHQLGQHQLGQHQLGQHHEEVKERGSSNANNSEAGSSNDAHGELDTIEESVN